MQYWLIMKTIYIPVNMQLDVYKRQTQIPTTQYFCYFYKRAIKNWTQKEINIFTKSLKKLPEVRQFFYRCKMLQLTF